jgi:aryl-alcohol dehydrogenase-like predicted oxidoreductase
MGFELVLRRDAGSKTNDLPSPYSGGTGRHAFRYGRSLRPWTNEEIVGETLAPFRGKIVIAAKFGWKPAIEGEARWIRLGSRAEHIERREMQNG